MPLLLVLLICPSQGGRVSVYSSLTVRDSLNVYSSLKLSLTVRECLCLLIPHSEGQSVFTHPLYSHCPSQRESLCLLIPHSEGRSVFTHPSHLGRVCVYSSLTVRDSLCITHSSLTVEGHSVFTHPSQ